MLRFILEPQLVYQRRISKLNSHRVLEELGAQTLHDIHNLFAESVVYQSVEMVDFFKPLDLTQIVGALHAIPSDAIKKLPTFQGNNTITAMSPLLKFLRHFVSYCNNVANDHDDVKMKLFALSLEEDAGEWYLDLVDNSYKTLNEFLEGFTKKWGEKKEPKHQRATLHNIKKMENETM